MERLVRKLPWKQGRQGTGYGKIRLFESRRFRCDGYLLYYPQGSEIPMHTDPVASGDHYRINFMLKKARRAGSSSARRLSSPHGAHACSAPMHRRTRFQRYWTDTA